MSSRDRRVFLRTSIAALLTLPFLFPFAFLLTVAFKTEEDYRASPIGLPTNITFEHLADAWQRAELGHALVNSMMVSVIGVIVAVLLSLSAAFWFFVFRSKWFDRGRWVLILGYAFPAVIWLIPLFVILARSGWTNSLFVLGVIYGVSNVPFGLFMIYAFYRQTLKSEIMDAAAVDGASILQQFARIAVPLARPAAVALAALVFVWSFGDLLFAVTLLQDPDTWTIPIAAATLVSSQRITAQAQASAALVALVPSLIVVLVAQRALVRGFGGGSVK